MESKTKLYTSRYQNPNLAASTAAMVGITLGQPRFKLPYNLFERLTELAPSREIFRINDRETFEPAMRARLDRHYGIDHITGLLAAVTKRAERELGDGTPLVLLCFEDIRLPGQWCHRQIVAAWWEEKTGQRVEEYPDLSEPKQPRPRSASARSRRNAGNGRTPRLLSAHGAAS